MGVEVRLDKWLQIARAFKTRSQATRACSLGRVKVNGSSAKAHRRVEVGDRIELERRDWTRVLVVEELRDRPLPKAEAQRLFQDLSPPKPPPDPLRRLMRTPPARREPGKGRPTKKERRQTDRLKGR